MRMLLGRLPGPADRRPSWTWRGRSGRAGRWIGRFARGDLVAVTGARIYESGK
jgi:hypothetical protein